MKNEIINNSITSGDKLKCKKAFITNSQKELITPGKLYKVEYSFAYGEYWISTNYEEEYLYFYTNKKIYNIWDYFYNKKQLQRLRKEKINKINGL